MANRHKDEELILTLQVTLPIEFKVSYSSDDDTAFAAPTAYNLELPYFLELDDAGLRSGSSVELPQDTVSRLAIPLKEMFDRRVRDFEWVSAHDFDGPPGKYHVTLSIDPEEPGEDWDLDWDGKVWEVHQTPSTKRVVWVRAPRGQLLPW